MTWRDDRIDDAGRLLYRAQMLLQGVQEKYGNGYAFPPRKNMKCEEADSAVIRAAAVLSAAAVNLLADELDERAPLTEEQLQELEEMEERAFAKQQEEAPQAAPPENATSDAETRQEGETEPSSPERTNRKRSKQTQQEPAPADVADPPVLTHPQSEGDQRG